MAKVNYVECSSCHREYYIDRILSEALISNPDQLLKCPFCKSEFTLTADKGAAKAAAAAR